MENWEKQFHWQRVKHFIKDKFNLDDLPKLEGILFLLGWNELSNALQNKSNTFSKVERADVIQLGAAIILESRGYFKIVNGGEGEWPTVTKIKPFEPNGEEGSRFLKDCIIERLENEIED